MDTLKCLCTLISDNSVNAQEYFEVTEPVAVLSVSAEIKD